MMSAQKTPVILDTDIGSDIDDTWALAFLLRCPELDLKIVVVSTGDTDYRAKLVAKQLMVAGRTDIAIGIGKQFHMKGGPVSLGLRISLSMNILEK